MNAAFEYAQPKGTNKSSFISLGCDRIKVNGGMFFHGSSFKGEVSLAGACVGSNLECDGSTFENSFNTPNGDRYAIRADRITANGGVFLRRLKVQDRNDGCVWQRFASKGAVRFINARIGVLDCSGASIEGDGKNGFNAEAATIAGHAVFDNFAIQNGGMEFRGLTADDASFRGAKLTTVDLRYATILRAIRVKQIVDVNQSLWDLRNASVGSVDDDEESWPQPGRFFIDGFTYQGFGSVSVEPPEESSAVPLDFKSRKQWVELDLSRPPHAYRQLASVYSRIGDTAKSRAALFALEDSLHCNGIEEEDSIFLRFIRRAWKLLLKVTIGYGYRLERAGWWLGLFLLVGFVVSYVGYSSHLIVPSDKDAYAFFAQPQHWYPPKSYPVFHASMFSVENGIPAINLSISEHWRAVGGLSWWFFGQRIVGWFLSIFFLAGITGLAKSDK